MEPDEIKTQLANLNAQVAHLITVVETRRTLVDGFDARIDKMITMERSLGTIALKLASAKVLTSWLPGAFAGAVAGAAVAWVLLQSGAALAH